MVTLEGFEKQLNNRQTNQKNLEALLFFRDPFLFSIIIFIAFQCIFCPSCTTRAPTLTYTHILQLASPFLLHKNSQEACRFEKGHLTLNRQEHNTAFIATFFFAATKTVVATHLEQNLKFTWRHFIYQKHVVKTKK